jgi:hypothetical protein
MTTFGVSSTSASDFSKLHIASNPTKSLNTAIAVLNPGIASESPISRKRKWAIDPIFKVGKSAASHPIIRATRDSSSARIFSAAIFLSTRHDQSVLLYTDDDCPNASMVDGYRVSKSDSI